MRIIPALIVALALVFALSFSADAHPLGNFTSNHLTRLDVQPERVLVHYVLDNAEIPTFSLLRSLDAAGKPSAAVLTTWGAGEATTLASQLHLTVDGAAAPLTVVNSAVRLRPGAGGLATLYFTADYTAKRAPGAHAIAFTDATFAGRIGWKDVVVAPLTEPTNELRRYPDALVGSPRDRTTVNVDLTAPGAPRVSEGASEFAPVQSAARMNALSDVLGRNLADPLVLFGAVLLAIGLGALHALEPGHGKTLLAVSLVGARATVSQAFVLATSLTIAHTIGVLVFGFVVLALARYVVPETLYPWIALISGGFVAILGARALAREIAKRRAFEHVHVHAHDAAHPHAHPHPHDPVHEDQHHAHHTHAAHDHSGLDDEAHALAHAIPGSAPIGFREALIAATSGNLAPCPAALVVLLAAIASHQVAYGLALIVAFSIGLATTLTLLGVAVVRSAAWLTSRPQFDRFARVAPVITAAAISVIGAWMLGQGFVAQGVVASPFIVVALVLVAIAAFAFLPSVHPHARKALA
jgi:nickel/cobalt exporter